jgi:hypothetical protein
MVGALHAVPHNSTRVKILTWSAKTKGKTIK